MAENKTVESTRAAVAGVLDTLVDAGAYNTPLYQTHLKFYGELEAILEEQRWPAVLPKEAPLTPAAVLKQRKPAPAVDWSNPNAAKAWIDWYNGDLELTTLWNVVSRQELENKRLLGDSGENRRGLSRATRACLASSRRKMLDSNVHYERLKKAASKSTGLLEGILFAAQLVTTVVTTARQEHA